MDIFLTILGFFFITAGVVGAILPVLPGPPISWLGLFCLNSTTAVPNNAMFIWATLAIALAVTGLDYIIPILGTKKFGGTKKGVWGSTIGLVFGLFFGPLGIILGPFMGAFVGEMIGDSRDTNKAFRAAVGSFIGFVFSTGLKLTVGCLFVYFFIEEFWLYKSEIIPF